MDVWVCTHTHMDTPTYPTHPSYIHTYIQTRETHKHTQVGLDTCLFILDGWVKAYPNEPAFVVPETLRQLVKAGKLGRKTGEGYWKWEGDKRTNTPAL